MEVITIIRMLDQFSFAMWTFYGFERLSYESNSFNDYYWSRCILIRLSINLYVFDYWLLNYEFLFIYWKFWNTMMRGIHKSR